MRRNGKSRGAILILAFIFLVALSGIVVTYISLVGRSTKIVGFGVTDSQALYLAEAGIHRAIWYLENTAPDGSTDGSWRTTAYPADPGPNPTDPQQESFGNGSFIIWVEGPISDIQITSRGIVAGLERTVRQEITFWPVAFSYAVFGDTNPSTLRFKDNVAVSGDVYYGGDIEVQVNASITDGYVYADSVSGAGTYTEALYPASPSPSFPSFDASYYDNEITTGEGAATSDWTLSGTDSYDLAGGTVYYKKVTIKGNATVIGPGTIVATKNVKIEGNATIGQNITIISKKDITIKTNASIQSGAVIYSQRNITVKNNAKIIGSLLSPKNNKKVLMEDSAQITGIIYADKVELNDSSVVNGSVVADAYQSNEIGGDVTVNYGVSYIPTSIPQGFDNSEASAVTNTWQEL